MTILTHNFDLFFHHSDLVFHNFMTIIFLLNQFKLLNAFIYSLYFFFKLTSNNFDLYSNIDLDSHHFEFHIVRTIR